MKYIMLGAAAINSSIGVYNLLFSSMSWSVFNFVAAAACTYSYLDLKD